MRNILLSSLLLSGCLFCFAAPPVAGGQGAKRASQTSGDPLTVVRQFYAWYLGRLNKDDYEPLKRRAEALKYLTPELHGNAPRLTRDLNADIFICAQDWEPSWAENFTVAPPAVRGARATTTVTLKAGEGDAVKVRVSLLRVGGAWKINGVSCAE